jgi:hypothetical protein
LGVVAVEDVVLKDHIIGGIVFENDKAEVGIIEFVIVDIPI